MSRTDWVRVHVPTIGRDVSMTRMQAEKRGSRVEVLDADAVDRNGRPLPPKTRKRPTPKPSGKASETTTTPKESA